MMGDMNHWLLGLAVLAVVGWLYKSTVAHYRYEAELDAARASRDRWLADALYAQRMLSATGKIAAKPDPRKRRPRRPTQKRAITFGKV